MPVLQIEHLKKEFDGAPVLRGIDLSVEKGDVIAVLGPSGSGKTTLLRCINFLTPADEGILTFDGQRHDLAQQVHEHERGEVDDLPQAAGAHDGGLALLGALQAAARQQRVAGGHEQAEHQSGRAAEQILSDRHLLSLPICGKPRQCRGNFLAKT